jgi:phosphonopyruvate decarboxylase
MISADAFLQPAFDRDFSFYTGVPCSFLTPLINRVIGSRNLTYVGAASEGEAVAIAAGAWLAGRQSVVMCQNSGLGNTVNPLTSLNHPFRIPCLMVVTWRGQPGLHDEPQHAVMGEITADLLKVMQIEHAAFPSRPEQVAPTLCRLEAVMAETELPFALIMPKGSVEDQTLEQQAHIHRPRGAWYDLTTGAAAPRRIEALGRTLSVVPQDTAVVATTGKTGRELFTVADREQHLYLVGSMGCASGLSLGIALNSSRRIVVLDGDGAALMKLGTLATIGAYRPSNLVHLILDNGVHDSTGGQATVSPNVDFAAAAIACGYRTAFRCDDLNGFECALKHALDSGEGPVLLHLRITPGSIEKLGRPNVSPYDVARRFKQFLSNGAAGPQQVHTRATQERAHA